MRVPLLGLMAAAFFAFVGTTQAEGPLPPGARRAVEEYWAEIEEIDRTAAKRKGEAKARLLNALETDLRPAAAPSGPRYRGMLGSYFNQDGVLPFILLSTPNGQNVFGDYARSVFNGRYDFSKPLVRLQARGHVIVPRDGQYRLEAGRGYCDFKINALGYSLGEQLPLRRYGANVTLKAGEYDVEVSSNNNGGQLPDAAIRIVELKTDDELPLFFYESELKAFRAEIGARGEPAETSKWTEAENRITQ